VYPGADSDEEELSAVAGNQENEDVNSIYMNVPSHQNLYDEVGQVGTLSYASSKP